MGLSIIKGTSSLSKSLLRVQCLEYFQYITRKVTVKYEPQRFIKIPV